MEQISIFYAEGRYAAFSELSADDCPYTNQKQINERAEWLMGFLQGLVDMSDRGADVEVSDN
jgi:ribosome modulation factor